MDENIKTYIQTNALLGLDVILNDNLPSIKLPTLESLNSNVLPYLYYIGKYVETFEEKRQDMYFDIIKSQDEISEFALLLTFFIKSEKLEFNSGSFLFDNNKCISFVNIVPLMEALRVLHHKDSKEDYYTYANKTAQDIAEKSRRLKKEYMQKHSKNNGIGFAEIVSAVCARHPSNNLLNIGDLNYYQLIDQYKRLMSIDRYTPLLYGNATEEYIKNNNIKHYVEKIENES